MKITHIVLLVILAVGVAMIASTYNEASKFVSFEQAAQNPDTKFHVKTKLVKSKPIEYNPQLDAEKFTFYAIDENGQERKVICFKEMPFDFERSEEVVIIGKAAGVNEFVATEYQTKCPSKYEDEVADI